MKRTIKFIDAAGNKAEVTVEIQSERNGYKEFSSTGQWCGHLGQCLDHIQPKNEAQGALLTLCDKWHLNGMNAGTEEQKAVLKKREEKTGKKHSYDEAVAYLKKVRKYTVKHPKTGKPYQYGHGWLVRELPADIEAQANALMDEVEAQEIASKVKDRELEEAYTKHPQIIFNLFAETYYNADEAKKVLAVGLNEGLTVRETLEITVEGRVVTCQGMDYLVGNDEEMDEEWDEYLENYIDDCLLCEIKDETLKNYFDRDAWKSDAKHDGRGHSLNGYDGGEDSRTVDGEEIYIYRR